MKKYTILQPSQKWAVVEQYLRGVAPHELCKQPGVSRSQIQRWLVAVQTRAGEIFRPARFDEPAVIRKNTGSAAEHEQSGDYDLEGAASGAEPERDSDEQALIETLRERIDALKDRNAFLEDCVEGNTHEFIAVLEKRVKELTADNKRLRTELAILKHKGKRRLDPSGSSV